MISGAGCSKENQIEIIDNPPVVIPDTSVVNYFGNLVIGNSPVPVDTVFTNVQFANSGSTQENVGYDLQTFTGLWVNFFLHWDPNSPNETGIQEGNYTACCAVNMNENAQAQILSWIAAGRNPATMPQIDPSNSYDIYFAADVNVNISNLQEAVRYELIGNDTIWIDRAKVKLSGLLQDSTNQFKAVSGEFVCYFSR